MAAARRRFIPAPAGNACPCTPTLARAPVHPRACGERLWQKLGIANRLGSSPRLRGTRARWRGRSAGRRFIPAPAGNAGKSAQARPARSVHPRACGERRAGFEREASEAGSSPRLRGTLLPCWAWAFVLRFIPAPAGNARFWRCGVCPMAVHPRACGERTLCERAETR